MAQENIFINEDKGTIYKKIHYLLENLGYITFQADKKGNVTYANKKAEDITGKFLENIVGKPFLPLFTQKSQKIASDVYQRTLLGKSPVYELTFTNKKIGRFKNEPLRNQSGEIIGVFGIIRDITEHKKNEQQLNKYRNHLEKLVEQRTAELTKINENLNREIAERKRAEEKTLILNHAIHDSPLAVVITDLKGIIEYVNPGLLHIGGFDSDKEIIGKNILEFLPSSGQKLLVDEIIPTILKEDVWKGEIDVLHRDGSSFPTILGSSIIRDESGNPWKEVGIFRGISELKQAEEEIRKFKTISEKANYGVSITDLNGQIKYINEYFASIHGYRKDEILGKNLLIFHNEKQLKEVIKINEKLQQQGSYSAIEVWHTHKDGSVFPMLMHGIIIKDEDGKPLFMAATAIDITERKQVEQALQKSEERYRALYEENPAMYFTVNTDGTVLSVNQFGAAQLGYTVEDLVGQPVINVFYKDDREIVLQHLKNCLQNPKKIFEWEFRKIRKDGSILWVREIVRVVPDVDGNMVILIVCEDITESIKAQKEKEKLLTQLAETEKLVTLGQFTAGIAHELNNPLHIILGKLYLLQKSLPCNSEQWDHFVKIKQQIHHISQLGKDILNYAKPHAILLKPVEINSIILQAIDSLSNYFANNDILITTDLKADIPQAQGDAIGLELVFKNSILNAIESIQQKGKIIVSTRMKTGKVLEIAITDNGKGIPEEDIPNIFNPFYTRKRESGGTGLGLAICKEIINKHNGTIKLQSKLNKGTTVIIHLSIGPGKVEL